MKTPNWENEVPMSITVCDAQGKILYMNDRSKDSFSSDGGASLVGKNLLDCHSPASQDKIRALLASKENNIYTISKKGKKKMIVQMPWYEKAQLMGLVELSFELPADVPHFDRDKK